MRVAQPVYHADIAGVNTGKASVKDECNSVCCLLQRLIEQGRSGCLNPSLITAVYPPHCVSTEKCWLVALSEPLRWEVAEEFSNPSVL